MCLPAPRRRIASYVFETLLHAPIDATSQLEDFVGSRTLDAAAVVLRIHSASLTGIIRSAPRANSRNNGPARGSSASI